MWIVVKMYVMYCYWNIKMGVVLIYVASFLASNLHRGAGSWMFELCSKSIEIEIVLTKAEMNNEWNVFFKIRDMLKSIETLAIYQGRIDQWMQH